NGVLLRLVCLWRAGRVLACAAGLSVCQWVTCHNCCLLLIDCLTKVDTLQGLIEALRVPYFIHGWINQHAQSQRDHDIVMRARLATIGLITGFSCYPFLETA